MEQFVTTLRELAEHPPAKLLVLYSGGVDGSYLLQWARHHEVPVVSLSVRIGQEGEPDATIRAEHFDAEHHEVDATEEFYADFLPPAIHADAYYQNLFPVGSTLSRPLMARCAAGLAERLGCDAVGHTATYMQNSSVRLSASLVALRPQLRVVAPFLGADLSREEKLAALAVDGITFSTGIHSVDANPWSRVIECGSLEDPENPIPEDVFAWTRAPGDTPARPAELDLRFREGRSPSTAGRSAWRNWCPRSTPSPGNTASAASPAWRTPRSG